MRHSDPQIDMLHFFDAHCNRPLFWVLTQLKARGYNMRQIRQAYKQWLEEAYL